jgi:hypothetical protein
MKKAEFLSGLIKIKAWLKPYMNNANVPDKLQVGVVKILMNSLAEKMLEIENARKGFIVVDTRGSLTNKALWENEIHPNSDGFKLIADKMLSKIYKLFPTLGS